MLASPDRHTEIAATIPNAKLTLEVCVDGSQSWDTLATCSALFEDAGAELSALKCNKAKALTFRVSCPNAGAISVLEAAFSKSDTPRVLSWSVTIGRVSRGA